MNLSRKTIFLTGDLDEESASKALIELFEFDALDNSDYSISQAIEPINIVIDSYGGDIYSMWTIYDAMRLLKRPVHTTGLGKVMSGSVLLLAAGKKGERIAGKNTTFMVHAGSVSELSGKADEALHYVEHVKDMDNKWYDIMKSITSISVDWKRICSDGKDFYFNAHQALEFGIIDRVI